MIAEIVLRNDSLLFAILRSLLVIRSLRVIRSLLVKHRLQDAVRGVSPNRLCLSLSVIMLVCTWSEGHEGDNILLWNILDVMMRSRIKSDM